MAEDFQNTITLQGALPAVEEMAQKIGAILFENMVDQSVGDFLFLPSNGVPTNGPEEIATGCLFDSIVFEKEWAKISMSFQTRRGPFPAPMLTPLMKKFSDVFVEVETIGDCCGLKGILAKGGKIFAIRQLDDLEKIPTHRTNLITEYFSHRLQLTHEL